MIEKSQYDKKEYRVIQTGEEGSLEALLVSTKGLLTADADPRDAKAAAAFSTFADRKVRGLTPSKEYEH